VSKRSRNQGELESLVLNILWAAKLTDSPKLTSNQILDELPSDSDLALTTVLTVLSRLSDKQLVSREAGTGRALVFEATQTQAQHNAGLMLGILSNTQNPRITFSHFASQLTPEQLEQLRDTLG
jgi:predicted transcriptional regulator